MGEHPPNMFDSLSTSLTCSSSNEDIPVPVHDPAQVHGAIALLLSLFPPKTNPVYYISYLQYASTLNFAAIMLPFSQPALKFL